jgi:lipoprotein-releasing system permease protein
MKISVNTEIAITYLSSRKKQTLIASLGVMFGISMFIFMQSLMKGTNDYFEKQSFNNIAHVHIYNENKIADTHIMERYLQDKSIKVLSNPKQVQERQGLINPFGIIAEVKKDTQVVAVSPQVTANVFYTSGNIQLNGIVVGVDIIEHNKMFDLKSDMVSGSIDELQRVTNGIVIGKGIAEKLSLHMGDNITVVSANGDKLIMRVVGIYATTIIQTDNSKSYANISQVQNL